MRYFDSSLTLGKPPPGCPACGSLHWQLAGGKLALNTTAQKTKTGGREKKRKQVDLFPAAAAASVPK